MEQLCERARDELRHPFLRSICLLRASARTDLNLAVLLVVLADPPSDLGTTTENWDWEGVGGVENEDVDNDDDDDDDDDVADNRVGVHSVNTDVDREVVVEESRTKKAVILGARRS